ncbi:hypothetical protein CTEN210_14095 [Chaetoceros tenuissimus]|uniref:Uncharacterized protein n=1 Tax=Chaetoceros tenuissimus TaxID=426638 RepID=A0AAD3HC08_9STRA|nr:hypothetical protein CTEN210_14095 [Chaetoceros tenuissimus]
MDIISQKVEWLIPRASGATILSIYIKCMVVFFEQSKYGLAFHSGKLDKTSIPLNGIVAAASLINVMSHSAVALGMLNDTYTISIMVGVGFDILSRSLTGSWWIYLSMRSNSNEMESSTSFLSTILLQGMILSMFLYQMHVHITALYLNHNLDRLKNVLHSSLNNLRGIPGKRWKDHLFAYTDLGFHVLPFLLAMALLKRQGAVRAIFYSAFILVSIFYGTLHTIPLSADTNTKSISSLFHIFNNETVDCSCEVCSHAKRRRTSSKPTSFTFNPLDGICKLWLCSFTGLQQVLELSLDRRETSKKK